MWKITNPKLALLRLPCKKTLFCYLGIFGGGLGKALGVFLGDRHRFWEHVWQVLGWILNICRFQAPIRNSTVVSYFLSVFVLILGCKLVPPDDYPQRKSRPRASKVILKRHPWFFTRLVSIITRCGLHFSTIFCFFLAAKF